MSVDTSAPPEHALDQPKAAPNPYIGPRAFRPGESLYGRDRDVRQLVHQLLADRIVLLYSPSGAGKTSLIQAALVPALKLRGLESLPIVRVNQTFNNTSDGPPLHSNRYIQSTLLALEEQAPASARQSEAALSNLTLTAYLDQLEAASGPPHRHVLIFDQFEESLTADPTDLGVKREFFQQLGQALLNPNRWALFAMREDYVAGLDPYKRAIPGRLASALRLDLLDESGARAAIHNPALHASEPGVCFDDDAVGDLVDNLRRVRIQTGGVVGERLGAVLEPVQLQVVCSRLWDKRQPKPGEHITRADLAEIGDVKTALAGYYADRVHQVADESRISERRIREWIESNLVTEQGLRGQVLQGETETERLDASAIELLKSAYLIRSEVRRGLTWLELAHDQLVDPVRSNNAAYRDSLHPLVQRAASWRIHGRRDDEFLDAQTLRDARSWVSDHPGEITADEEEFLDRSSEAVEQELRRQQDAAAEDRRRRRAQRMRWVWAGILIGGVVLSTLTGWAWTEKGIAETQAMLAVQARGEAMSSAAYANDQQVLAETHAQDAETQRAEADTQRAKAQDQSQLARARLLATRSQLHAGDHLDLAFLLAVQANRMQDTTETRASLLYDLSAEPYFGQLLAGHTNWVRSIAFNHTGTFMASGGLDDQVILWDSSAHEVGKLPAHTDTVYSVAFSSDDTIVASGSADGTVGLWDTVAEKAMTPLKIGGTAYSVAFNPQSDLLAVGTSFGVELWSTKTWRLVYMRLAPNQPRQTYRVGFNKDGTLLASGGASRVVTLWDVATLEPIAQLTDDQQDLVFGMAFSPDGKLLVTGAADDMLNVWDVDTRQRIGGPLKAHDGSVFDVSFNSNGTMLASAGADKTVVLWDVNDGKITRRDEHLGGYAEKYYSVAFSPGAVLASGASDGRITWWDYEQPRRVGESIDKNGRDAYAVDFSPTEDLVASATRGEVDLWEGGPPGAPGKGHELLGTLKVAPKEDLTTVKFSPDGKYIAAGGSTSGDVFVWDVAAHQQVPNTPLRGSLQRVSALSFSPDGKSLAVVGCALPAADKNGCPKSDLSVWDLETQTAQHCDYSEDGSDVLLTVAFNRWGTVLAAAGEYGWITTWDVATRKQRSTIRNGPRERIYSIAFSPTEDGLLASSSNDTNIMLWDTVGQQRLAVFPALHQLGVVSLAFSPDGKLLAAGSLDKTASVWDVASRQPVYHLPAEHQGRLQGVAFNRDGRQLASAATGTDSVILWDVSGDSWRSMACELAGRNLTADEWHLYIDPSGDPEQLCPQPMLAEALAMARTGNRSDARQLLRQTLDYVARAPEWVNDWLLANQMCWDSSIEGFAAEAMPTCERIFSMAPPQCVGWLSDTRAVARALAGNSAGALEDWQTFISWADDANAARTKQGLKPMVPDQPLNKRKQWVADLKEGRSPLDAATLKDLRIEIFE